MSEIKPLDADTIRKYEAEYVLTPWTAQKGLNPFVAAKGEGCWIHSAEGKKVRGLHLPVHLRQPGPLRHPAPAGKAIARQAALLPSVNSQWATEPKAVLGKLLAEITPGDLKKSFFSTGGTEANEGAIKIARWATGKQKVLSRWRSYHGSTMGAMAVSADYRNWCAEPSVPGAVHILPPYCYRCHFGGTYPSCDIQCAKHVEDVIRLEGGALVGGRADRGADLRGGRRDRAPGGVLADGAGHLRQVRGGADRRRDHDRLRPDRQVVRDGQLERGAGHRHHGQGHQLGARCRSARPPVRPWIAEKFETMPYLHGHTYSGHALSMAAAVATIEAYRQDNLIERAAKTGDYLMGKMKELQDKHPCIGEVRGKGLFCGIEIVKNRKTREPIHEAVMEPPRPATSKMTFLGKCMQEGVYIMAGGGVRDHAQPAPEHQPRRPRLRDGRHRPQPGDLRRGLPEVLPGTAAACEPRAAAVRHPLRPLRPTGGRGANGHRAAAGGLPLPRCTEGASPWPSTRNRCANRCTTICARSSRAGSSSRPHRST